MRKWFIPIAVAIWLLALLGTLIFRGNNWANIILLAVSLGMIGLGLFSSRQKKQ